MVYYDEMFTQDKLWQKPEGLNMMKGYAPVMVLEKTTKNIPGQRKIPAVKTKPGRHNRVIIRVPFHQDLIDKVKSISRRKWNPEEKYREVPYNENFISRILDLLESGIDLRYIQELLGHKSSKTTEVYTHVNTKKIWAIKSPLDNLLEEVQHD